MPLTLAVLGVFRARLLEAAQRVGELADERPQDTLGERLLQLDLLEAARALVEGGQALGDDVLARARQVQADDEQDDAERRREWRTA